MKWKILVFGMLVKVVSMEDRIGTYVILPTDHVAQMERTITLKCMIEFSKNTWEIIYI